MTRLNLDFGINQNIRRDMIAAMLLCSYQQQGAKHSGERLENQIIMAIRSADSLVAALDGTDELDREDDTSDIPDADEVLSENEYE